MPCAGPLTSTAEGALPSGSESFASTPGAAMTSAVSSAVVKLSGVATGASFVPVTVIVSVDDALPPFPSLTV